jgi:ubiquinone/menaquinone biosynthesis C-methylase UbiE
MAVAPNRRRMSNEARAAAAFSKQSAVFDTIYGTDTIVGYKRSRVRQHVLQYLPAQSQILELNSGTGEDALYFAGLGHNVHATDYAPGMLDRLERKMGNAPVTTELCSFTELSTLGNKGPYDLIFSNFAGLNCTGQLKKVLMEFEALLKPGGLVTLVILPPFCLWETALLLKGKWKTAFRRWFSAQGRTAKVEGIPFRCWYYSPITIERLLRESFETLDLEGLCTIVPPSYMEGFAEKHPGLYALLCRWENRFSRTWPFKIFGDYFIITLRMP